MSGPTSRPATGLPLSPATAAGSPSPRAAAVTAGAGLLLMAVFAAVGYGVAVGGLVTPGDATRTATDVLASAGLFRVGIVCLLAVAALDVVVAWGLYYVYRRTDPGLSLLAAAFRLAYAAVFTVAISELAGAVDLLGSAEHLAVFGADQLHAQASLRISAFHDVWNAGLGLFGLHLLLVGGLAHRSGSTPRVIGVLVAVAGLGYAVDSVAAVLTGGTAPAVSPFLFVGEVLLAVWLLLRGGRVPAGDAP